MKTIKLGKYKIIHWEGDPVWASEEHRPIITIEKWYDRYWEGSVCYDEWRENQEYSVKGSFQTCIKGIRHFVTTGEFLPLVSFYDKDSRKIV